MKVSYENNLEDLVALAEHQLSTHAAYQKRRRWNLYGHPVAMMAFFGLVAFTVNKPLYAIAGAVGAVISFFWMRRIYRNFPRKAVEKQHREKPQKGIFCRHEVTISAEGFSEETTESRQFLTWGVLHEVAFTPDHILVYNTPATAHIIPRHALGDEQFRHFGEELRRLRAGS